MTHEQFYYWLEGVLENKAKVKKSDIDIIRKKMKDVSQTVWWPPTYIPGIQDLNPPTWTIKKSESSDNITISNVPDSNIEENIDDKEDPGLSSTSIFTEIKYHDDHAED